MSANGYVIAVDNGSQSTKVTIFDAKGVTHASAQVRLRPYESPAPGRWEHPDDDIWDSITQAIREVLDQFEGDVNEIRGLGLCTIRFCRAVLRADGTLAQPVMSWMDDRVSQPFHAETEDARFVTTSSGYITHRLTGQLRDTAGNYQGFWPIDTKRWAWSDQDADYARTGLAREQLFELVLPGEELGAVTPDAADATGLPQGIPVIATSNDKAVEALGSGLQHDGQVVLSLGTYVASSMIGSGLVPADENYWINFGAEPDRLLFESAGIRRGMWTVSWFRDLLTEVTEEELDRGAAQVPPGSDGLVVSLDWLAPEDQPERRGAIVGFDGTQGRFHIYRAILEALAITMAENSERISTTLHRQIEEVIVTGGGALSSVILEVLSAVYGVPVRRPVNVDAAGVGAAITAAVATGLHPSWQQAVESMVQPDERVDVNPELVAEYRGVRERYARVIPRARRLFADE